MLDGLDLARARRLEQAEAVARSLLGILVALPLVIDFQAGPFIRVHRTNVGSLVFAVGRRLRGEQRRFGSVDSQFSISARFGVSMGTDGSCPDLVPNRSGLTVSRIARAPGDRHRAEDDRDGQKLLDERRKAPRPRTCRFAAVVSIMRWTRDPHTHNSGSKRGKLQRAHRNKMRAASTAIMNGKVESYSNNQDESDVNQKARVMLDGLVHDDLVFASRRHSGAPTKSQP
jgi:hypothetical protein